MSSEQGIWKTYGAMILTAGGSAALAVGILAFRAADTAEAGVDQAFGLLAASEYAAPPDPLAEPATRAGTSQDQLLPGAQIPPNPSRRVLSLAAALKAEDVPMMDTSVLTPPDQHGADHAGHDHSDHDHSGHDHSAHEDHGDAPRLAALDAPTKTDAVSAPVPSATDQKSPGKPGKKAKAPDCVRVLKTIASRATIYFNSGSAIVDARGKAAAYVLASQVQACPNTSVTIVGHADPTGDANLNLALSWLRANNVLHAITAAGFDPSRFRTHSHLQDHPAKGCEHYDAVDRRTEFSVRWTPPDAVAQN
ncbi:OmpA family protein [Aliishimia ponticola]|nr:OmpA family protein [Aliishimia ponticola]